MELDQLLLGERDVARLGLLTERRKIRSYLWLQHFLVLSSC